MTMRTLPLTGRALALAKDLAKYYEEQTNRFMVMMKEQDELRQQVHQQMSSITEAVKREMGLPKEAHVHIDATYLKEHDVAFAQVHDTPSVNGMEMGGEEISASAPFSSPHKLN